MSWRVQVEFQCDELDCESRELMWTEVRATLDQEGDSWNGTHTTVELEPAGYPEGWDWGYSPTRFTYCLMCPRCIARQPKNRVTP